MTLTMLGNGVEWNTRGWMKNTHAIHDFQDDPESGYDPDLDGPNPEYARFEVECSRCGEKRRIGCSISYANYTGGCKRKGKSLKPGDILVTSDGALEEYVSRRGDRIKTWCMGNTGYHFRDKADLRPY